MFKNYWPYTNRSKIQPPTDDDLLETPAVKINVLIQTLANLFQVKLFRGNYMYSRVEHCFPGRYGSEANSIVLDSPMTSLDSHLESFAKVLN